MSWPPTDKQVERAANAAASAENEHFEACDDSHSVYEHIARAVLDAVGPSIAAGSLREASEALVFDLTAADGYDAWLKARARQIEQEARRG